MRGVGSPYSSRTGVRRLEDVLQLAGEGRGVRDPGLVAEDVAGQVDGGGEAGGDGELGVVADELEVVVEGLVWRDASGDLVGDHALQVSVGV